jgi:hypothetical protein
MPSTEPPSIPGTATAYCAACARSGVGACDDFPNCPAGGMPRREMPAGNLAGIVADVMHELSRAEAIFAPIASGHEGYAVILEEVEELWDEVRLKSGTPQGRRNEAIQVAAMAIRFVKDVSSKECG